MANCHSEPRALFLFMDEEAKTDREICSGQFPSHLKGKPCPFSDRGRIPEYSEFYGNFVLRKHSMDRENPWVTSCMLQKLGQLDQWEKEVALIFPKELGQKDLYRCRQMFLVLLLD
ncbi:MAG: hypothetical protein A2Z14_00945 [Chloroflexi bacterium RBG_16_48_8]|nr:MAG: hypothetical protein A2Z14_00945 [Chloroflexi bacterium RBG_16_48_8]